MHRNWQNIIQILMKITKTQIRRNPIEKLTKQVPPKWKSSVDSSYLVRGRLEIDTNSEIFASIDTTTNN